MYIEQGRKGELGMWKYILPPVGFLLLMLFNYLLSSGVDVEQQMQIMVKNLGKPITFIVVLAPFVAFFGGLLFWVKFVHQQSIRSLTTSRKKIDWKRVFFTFGVYGLFIIISTIIGYYLSPEDYQINFNVKSFILLFITALILIPIQTSFEEYMFRGYMMQGIGLAVKNRWIPLLITSCIFGLMHLGNPEVTKLGLIIMVYYIGTGLFLGIITLMDEGLELALGFHAANNFFQALLVTATWTAFQTDSILIYTGEPGIGLDLLFPVLVIYPIFLIVLAKKYKWSNWKEKLLGKVEEEPQGVLEE
ncbi:CPBP family intramembrane glutamic endopeptidase [Aquimarina brevivitae]|uniref:CAAX prenyl protease 2/Lysostaphin resistance protein A-like domain-containing protein n=1 Tax=Aquimarina brevivitae TaxID=323412 RepID=A0A4Q7P209_9FLAO|nr:CPBP family intramembrane glutamic endopeptidase [Aquimarina brevivitae]RZS93906.1 hypothetical protein EV197_2487 [Aquimarina brevivitae]